MYQKWLMCLYLISFSSHVFAFYPYQTLHESNVQKPLSILEKRFRSLRTRNVHKEERDSAADSTSQLLKLDLHKVERRDNKFSKLLSNNPSPSNALAIHQDGSDYSYFSTMKFGSKAQEMYMLIDTGSANTWVFSSDCKSNTCAIHNTFGTEDSTTLKATSQTWDLAYGTGEVQGVVATDQISFANYTINMGFGLATNASDDFNNYPMDGILGLGRQASDQLGTPTIMEVLDKQTNLGMNILGVHLHRAVDGSKDGEITFGGVDTSKFSGTLAYTSTSNDDAWEIPVEDMLVNGSPAKFSSRSAIIDTGTTFILMPPGDAKILHGLLPGSQANGETYTLPCSSSAKLEVKISGKLYGISPKDYVGKPVSSGSSTCSSTIIGHQAFGATQWILGDVFLKNVYVVFDFDEKRIGLGLPGSGGTANLVAASSSSSSSASASASASGISSSISSSLLSTSLSSTATASPPLSGSVSGSTTTASQATSTGSGSSSTSRPSSGSSDSNIGAWNQQSAAHRGMVSYWKVGFSICLGLMAGVWTL